MSHRHVIIPIFVPHKGCPHDCIFCNQKKISGQLDDLKPEQVSQIVEEHLKTIDKSSFVEIAFYGGSFTAIDLSLQESYLKAAAKYVETESVTEIRLSTRPDCINEEILELLRKYYVKTIELGVQSLDDEVLSASNRGHDSKCVCESARLIKQWGFRLGIQTMTGLPGDTREKCINTAKKVIEIAPEIVRIYPVLVIKGTELERKYIQGIYEPQSLDEAVDLCAELLSMYEEHNIKVIRIGLQATENINENSDSEVAAGPIHPAIRQLVEARLSLKKIEEALEKEGSKDINELIIYTGPNNISNVIGQKRANIKYLESKYHMRVKIKTDDSIGKEIVLKNNNNM